MEINLKLSVFNDENESDSLVKVNIENLKEDEKLIDCIYREIEKTLNIPSNEFCLETTRGCKITSKTLVKNGDTFQLCPLVLGGKGGFGSLLRAFGKQITLSTNKEACRDLTGRRIRHVNNEKKLKDFLSKQNELAKQKEQEKKEKAERRRKKRERIENNHHLFVDPKYDEQKQKISQDLDEAIKIASSEGRLLKKKRDLVKKEDEQANPEAPCSSKSVEPATTDQAKKEETKAPVAEPTKSSADGKNNKKPTDKFKGWMGVDDLDVSSSDEDIPAIKSICFLNLLLLCESVY
jgi:hypothetical protein